MTNEIIKEVDLPFFSAKNVHMKDKEAVKKTIKQIWNDGANKLQIITDFDRTVTKQHVDGKQVLSSFCVFEKSAKLPECYITEAKRLYDKYRPIELDPKLSMETKVKAMEEWMLAANKMTRDIEFHPSDIEEVVGKYSTELRDGTRELFEKLNAADVPILVFSAGLGDVVEAILRTNQVLLENVKVISNFLKYNGNKLDGFKQDKLMHVFNKNEHAIDQDYFKVLKGRHNVMLLGDSVGDTTMAEGVQDLSAVLKIGFLYDHVDEYLEQYMDKFDIVLVDDQTMKIPTTILDKVL